MNKKIKEDWIKALRSGEYSQGNGYLNHLGDHCCLGVLCDLYVKAGLGIWETYEDDKPNEIYSFEDGSISESGVLLDSIKEWAELDSVTGEISLDPSEIEILGLSGYVGGDEFGELVSNQIVDLTELNDGGITFNQIADLIEEYL